MTTPLHPSEAGPQRCMLHYKERCAQQRAHASRTQRYMSSSFAYAGLYNEAQSVTFQATPPASLCRSEHAIDPGMDQWHGVIEQGEIVYGHYKILSQWYFAYAFATVQLLRAFRN